MKKILYLTLLALLISGKLLSADGFTGRPLTQSVWNPTGYTLNKGEFQIGIGPIDFGISDRFQIGTNILLFLFQDYNLEGKYAFVKGDNQALSGGLKIHHFNLEVNEDENGFTSFSPFLSFTTRLGPNTMLNLGGQVSIFSGNESIKNALATATSTGTSAYIGIDYNFSARTKFLIESGYDFTFLGFRSGAAVVFAWKSFHLKLGVNYFHPKETGGFVLPLIGLWWRFQG